jgi:(p)ppGpp synthase/HD superfamily hydrolase
LRVVRRLQNLGFDDQHTLAAAWLHDTVEDGALIWQTLKDEGIPDAVISTVEALTKKLGERYPAYLIRVKANPRACNVKIADILDNLSDAPTRPQIVRYAKALIYLHES